MKPWRMMILLTGYCVAISFSTNDMAHYIAYATAGALAATAFTKFD